jgi:hypothetical protein
MIKELDTIVLTRDVEQHGLKKGDMGAVVHLYNDGKTLEAEFITAAGKTVAVLTLSRDDIRLLNRKDILHVRELEIA